MTDITPASDNSQVASEQVETQKVETPEVTEEQKPEETQVVEEKAPSDSQVDEKADVDKRLGNAISAVQESKDEVRKIVNVQSELVSENPELIHKIAERDPILANKIVNNLWGDNGIKSYKQLMQRVKLEKLREENPEAYETQSKISDLESKLAEREAREEKALRSGFLKDKGILDNEYDPKFIKLNEALESLNPRLVKEDYQKALEMAHKLAFSDAQPVRAEVKAPSIPAIGGGVKPQAVPSSKPSVSDQSSWLADQLNQKLGYKINFNS